MRYVRRETGLFLGFSILAVLMAFAIACGGGGGTETGNPALTGDVMIGVTDAEGDFATYTVDVLSLTLTKSNGAVVQALPMTTRIDFSQYTDMTEFLTAVSVPIGTYVSVGVEVDFSDADIRVENAAGEIVQVTNIVDLDGDPIQTLDLTINFDLFKRLVVAAGIPAHLVLDFDLEASNAVTFDGGGVPTVTVDSLLSASVNVTNSKIHRVRGPLKSVNVADNSFGVIIRPFIHVLSGGDEDFGVLTVLTTDDTVYQIDGDTYQGSAGLAQLATMPALTATVALGDLKLNPVRFEAREVNAGSSVAGGALDVVTGNVTSRAADTITIRGATLMRADGSAVFNDSVTVSLDDTTLVRRQLSLTTYDIDDISVGQRLTVFGTLTNTDVDDLRLDAADGFAHMLYTTLHGTVSGAPGDVGGVPTVTMDLTSIDLRRLDLFDFTGTGPDGASDADPTAYEVDSGTLDVSGLADTTPIRVSGFVTPFGQSPPDFEAQTIIDLSAVAYVMRITWNPASAIAVTDTTTDTVTLDLTGTGLLHHVFSIVGITDLTGAAQPPTVAAPASDLGLYLMGQQGILRVYLSFERFAAGLQEQLDGGATIKSLVARGSFDEASTTLTAGLIGVTLH